jgi:hypothetical protein
LSHQAERICLMTVAIMAITIMFPHAVLATDSPTGSLVSLNGVLHFAYGTQSCSAEQVNCSPGSLEVSYITLPNGDNYRLLGVAVGMYPDGTKMLVTGWVQTPSASMHPLIFTGDITVTSFYAHCYRHES